ncbi:MAG: LPS-assembly protein LptD, partial [Bacteroidales bacterium]|nr:LPS-assembly protein LptD [Bacteroidales bacterium]
NDSLFFNHLKFKEKDFGFKHSVPLSTSIKFLRFFTFSPGVFYNGMIYTEKIEDRYWVWTDSLKKDGEFIDSVSNGLYYVQGYAPRASISTNPTLYGMYQFKKDGKIEAIRHVFDPNISFSYVPDMKGLVPDYYRTVYNPKTKKTEEYSIFEEGMYNTPTLSGQSGSVSFSLRNNLEMKVKTYSDSAQDTKKIVLIENLNISTSYNVFADSTQRAWSPIDMRSSHSLFNGKLNVSLTAQGSIYAIDSINTVEYIDKYIWESTNKFMRITNAGISLGSSFKSLQGSKTTNTENQPVTDTQDEVIQEITHKEYVDFDIPWDFHINYSLVYSKPYLAQKITQTLSFDGNFSLTPKWKIGFRSGWDFEANKLTYTTVNIYRDLHCWEARFNWVPFGRMKSYGFTIQAKAAILRDLKWDKPKESWYDNR